MWRPPRLTSTYPLFPYPTLFRSVSVNSIDQQIPSALTMEQALTTPRLATPGTIAGDHGRDIDSIRIQNRTRFDWGAVKLDLGAFVNAKSLDRKSTRLNSRH